MELATGLKLIQDGFIKPRLKYIEEVDSDVDSDEDVPAVEAATAGTEELFDVLQLKKLDRICTECAAILTGI